MRRSGPMLVAAPRGIPAFGSFIAYGKLMQSVPALTPPPTASDVINAARGASGSGLAYQLPLSQIDPIPFSVTSGGAVTVPAGTGRVFVSSTTAVTLTLPANDCLVMDRLGNAGAVPITVNPPSGTINGNPGYVIANNWGSALFVFDGTNYGVR
jgi:hypothetical protein